MPDLLRFVNVASDLLKINFVSCVVLLIRIADQILWHNSERRNVYDNLHTIQII